MPRRVVPLLLAVLAVFAASLLAGWLVRGALGLELSTDSLQALVKSMGWKAPAIFLGLLTFRQFIFLPAIVILPVGGLCFGTTAGTILGATGIVLSALITFAIARKVGGAWLRETFGAHYQWLEGHVERAGPPAVALVTAHPTGPMAAFFWAAGFSSMALLPFALAVTAGGSIRALAYSFFGSTLLVPGSPQFYAGATLLAVVAIVPLAHPALRRRLFGARRRARDADDRSDA
jgi:uncharacterized membrane protein YdjX (TVP38/TMEM64 family)